MEIETLLDEALAGGLGSAAAVSVGVGGREQLRLVRGRASAHGPPITLRTRFDLASLTKPMATAAIAMALVSEGKLGLGDSVRRYLARAATPATVAQLLGHAAGCAAHVEFWRTLAPGYKTLVDAAAAHPLAYAPGAQTTYSDLGYIMAGSVIEAAAGMPLRDAFARYVGEPFGLARTVFGPVPADDAVATEGDLRGTVHDENCALGGGACGHAGLFAPIGDVARFAEMITALLAGEARGRIDPETARAFATTSAAPATSWRLGWDTPSPTPGVSHAGDRWPREPLAIGHLGFTGTSIWLDPARGRWCVLLTNRVHPTRGGDTAERIKALRRAVNDAAIALT